MMKRIIPTFKKWELISNSTFIILLLIFPIILRLFFGFGYIRIKCLYVVLIIFWSVKGIFFSKCVLRKFNFYDVGFCSLFIFFILHFSFLSQTTFYDFKFWLYISYFLALYAFRWTIVQNQKNAIKSIHIFACTVILASYFESFIGLFQYFQSSSLDKNYLSLLGSFNSPNFFAGFIGYGFICSVWYLFSYSIKKFYVRIIIIIGIVILLIPICLSQSRGTWLSILVVLLVFFMFDKKNIIRLKKLHIYKLVLIASPLLALICFSLFNLRPESVKGRLLVAKISAKAIAKEPIKGHGVFSFQGKYNNEKAKYFQEQIRPWGEIKNANYIYTAFNDYILIAFELGVIVLILLLLLIVFIFLRIQITLYTKLGLVLVIYLCVFALFNTPSHSILIMSVPIFGLAILLNYGGFSHKYNVSITAKYIIKSVLLLFGSLLVYAVIMKFSSENKLINFGAIKNKGEALKLIELTKFSKDSRSSDAYIGRKLFKYGFEETGIKFMLKDYNATYNPSTGKFLAKYFEYKQNYKKAIELYKYNINIEPYRYEARMDLLSLLDKNNQYKEVVKLSNTIINLPIKIPSKKIDNYKKIANNYIDKYSKRLKFTSTVLKGSLSHAKLVKSKILNKVLPYKVYLPPLEKIEKNIPVIYINDGYKYISKGNLPVKLDSLICNNIIRPVAAIFLASKERNKSWRKVRQELFLCNPNFVSFYNQEFIPLIQNRYPVISNNYKHRTILGSSFGGLAALYIVSETDNVFSNIILQSPALHPCPDIYHNYYSKSYRKFNAYISYGTGNDTESQVIPMVKILKNKGYPLKLDIIENGDHNWGLWEKQLNKILIHFFKKI